MQLNIHYHALIPSDKQCRTVKGEKGLDRSGICLHKQIFMQEFCTGMLLTKKKFFMVIGTAFHCHRDHKRRH